MTWTWTMLLVDLATLIGCIALLRKAPCIFQTMAISFICAGFAVFTASDIADICNANWHWMVREVADRFVKLGIIVYVWRMYIDHRTNAENLDTPPTEGATEGTEEWTNSSRRYRRLLG